MLRTKTPHIGRWSSPLRGTHKSENGDRVEMILAFLPYLIFFEVTKKGRYNFISRSSMAWNNQLIKLLVKEFTKYHTTTLTQSIVVPPQVCKFKPSLGYSTVRVLSISYMFVKWATVYEVVWTNIHQFPNCFEKASWNVVWRL